MSSAAPIAESRDGADDPGTAEDHGVRGLPVSLASYLLAVTVLGPLVAITVAAAGARGVGRDGLVSCVILVGLGTAATRYPLQIRNRTLVSVTSSVFLMMVLGLPWPVPGVAALAAAWLGDLGRRRDRLEVAFDVGQAGLSVTAGAGFFALVRDRDWLGPTVGGLGSPAAIAATAVFAFLLNYGLVSIAAALQAGRRPIRVWWRNVRADYQIEAALAGVGVLGGVLAANEPATLPLLASPFVFLHRALENATRLRSDTFAALVKLNDVVELRDPYTAGHSFRVGELSRAVALRMALTVEQAEEIGSAGGVHDVGKIGIDPAILAKTGRLTPPEMEQMRLHPGLGADVVARFTTSGPIESYVRHHHERFDGRGYPDGLAGEAIPLGARIIAVADTFDALTTRRPYRDPLTSSEALEVLRDGVEHQWDANVVAAIFAEARSQGIAPPRMARPEAVRASEARSAPLGVGR